MPCSSSSIFDDTLIAFRFNSYLYSAKQPQPQHARCAGKAVFVAVQGALTLAKQEVLEALLQDAHDWLKPLPSHTCRSADEYRVKAKVCLRASAFALVSVHDPALFRSGAAAHGRHCTGTVTWGQSRATCKRLDIEILTFEPPWFNPNGIYSNKKALFSRSHVTISPFKNFSIPRSNITSTWRCR